MARIYISSTYSDLQSYREKAYHTLRQMQYDVIAMEDYVATDQRPLDKCLADVAACDLYVGLFAWRYGYIPREGNPSQKSITELEYRQALTAGKKPLIFLLDKRAPWPSTLMDQHTGEGDNGRCIMELRQELEQEKLVSFFQTPDELAAGMILKIKDEVKPPNNVRLIPRASVEGYETDILHIIAGIEDMKEEIRKQRLFKSVDEFLEKIQRDVLAELQTALDNLDEGDKREYFRGLYRLPGLLDETLVLFPG